jgi:hypothetical protein
VRGQETQGNVHWLRVTFESEPNVVVPALVALPTTATSSRAVLLAFPSGKQEAIEKHADMILKLVASSYAVICPDYRFVGELNANGPVWLVHGILWGRPAVAMAARDLRAAAHAAALLPGVTCKTVALVAFGSTAVSGLLATALDESNTIAAFACNELGCTYRASAPHFPPGNTFELLARRNRPEELAQATPPVLPNILTLGDLPEIAACLFPRFALLGGVADPTLYQPLCYARMRVESEALGKEQIAQWVINLPLDED